jgi:hypothetical protein
MSMGQVHLLIGGVKVSLYKENTLIDTKNIKLGL